ncbi:MarR family transcriptional regulator [Haloarcula nitratireducens]|uniref:MarR family transcriptional regulator n=1 Tax=Haloarcula nitratireducens TaxID=2487749 RepID=A0AAW4PGN3_9EURY|nr:MarR family transcriptional regulator [Halomicroarcula nitratireducens]MBX0296788.1 MarR family transcriptional regulator [Halomicroarcula nitratireducens]
MPPEERRKVVLEFMADHSIALPPKAIFRGLKIEKGITFSYRTVQTILSELEEQGFVARVDKESLDEGNIQPIPEDEAGRRAYYMITMDGRREVEAADGS